MCVAAINQKENYTESAFKLPREGISQSLQGVLMQVQFYCIELLFEKKHGIFKN